MPIRFCRFCHSAIAFLCALHALTVSAATIQLDLVNKADNKPVGDAVITLTPVGKSLAPKPIRAQIDQIDKEFVPRVSVISTGSSVTFPNKDNIRHQIYSFSAPKKFELKLYAGTPAAPVVFDKPGLVVLGCNIHDWMLSYLVVTDAPYYGKTESIGKLNLKDVAAGEYDVQIWHPNLRAEIKTRLVVSEPVTSLKQSLELSTDAAPVK